MNRLFLPILALVLMTAGCVSLPPETRVLLNEAPRNLEARDKAKSGLTVGYQRMRFAQPDGTREQVVKIPTVPYCSMRELIVCHSEASGEWERVISAMTHYGPDGFCVPPPSGHGYARTAKTSLRVQVPGATPDRVGTFEIHWVALPANWRVQKRVRSWWLLASYPLWGLPRDVLDAPITLAWRAGVLGSGETAYDKVTKPDWYLGLGVTAAGTVTAPLIALHAISPLAVAIPVAVIAAPAGFVVTGLVVLNCWMSAYHVREGLIRPCQAALLRGGIRSLELFPNWNFIVWDRRAVAREDAGADDLIWAIDEIVPIE